MLVRVDPISGKVVKRLPLGVAISREATPVVGLLRLGDVAVDEGAVWVGTRRFRA